MSDRHHHDDEHVREHERPLSGPALRAKALESLLVEKGLVDPKALDELIDTYETKVGPRNGARIVARAWANPAYKKRLLEDATAAIAEFGFIGRQGEDMVVLENVEVRVWDSTAELRYLVLPERPAGTEGWSEDELAEIVTRDAMIGVAQVKAPERSER